jgi:hypothetical protein
MVSTSTPLVSVALVSQLWRLCAASLVFGSVDIGAAIPDGGVHRGGGLGIHGG